MCEPVMMYGRVDCMAPDCYHHAWSVRSVYMSSHHLQQSMRMSNSGELAHGIQVKSLIT